MRTITLKPFAQRLRKAVGVSLLAWTLLSEMLGPGIGPGVSKDFKPLRQEEGEYRFEQKTQREYENAEAERTKARRKNELLFEQFYQREMRSNHWREDPTTSAHVVPIDSPRAEE